MTEQLIPNGPKPNHPRESTPTTLSEFQSTGHTNDPNTLSDESMRNLGMDIQEDLSVKIPLTISEMGSIESTFPLSDLPCKEKVNREQVAIDSNKEKLTKIPMGLGLSPLQNSPKTNKEMQKPCSNSKGWSAGLEWKKKALAKGLDPTLLILIRQSS